MMHTLTLAPEVRRNAGPSAAWASDRSLRAVTKLPDTAEIESDLDDALDDSFPASDPPSQTQPHPKRWLPNGKAPAADAGEASIEDPQQ
ncbi:MAG: hypothetical protein WC972_08835 [Trueperaceae bacterium]|jgi:hypothetical protein|nr:hypothetical protein [Truepera sp.]HRN18388.1 hypothetical protein [Trueperaceae bacterium]HRQ10877.1 hypothetical protein [Trueperaceae bacterium]